MERSTKTWLILVSLLTALTVGEAATNVPTKDEVNSPQNPLGAAHAPLLGMGHHLGWLFHGWHGFGCCWGHLGGYKADSGTEDKAKGLANAIPSVHDAGVEAP